MSLAERSVTPQPPDRRRDLLSATVARRKAFRVAALNNYPGELNDDQMTLVKAALSIRTGLDNDASKRVVVGSALLPREDAESKLLAMCNVINNTISPAIAIVVGSIVVEDQGELFFYPNASRSN